MEMKCLGIYEKKPQKGGIIELPKDWLEKGTKCLYAVLCTDLEVEVTFLRFYYKKEDLLQGVKVLQEEYAQVVNQQCYCVKIIPIWNSMILPKEFLAIGLAEKKSGCSCVGIGNGFEVWYTEDLEKIETCYDLLLESLGEF